ncbi:beta-lactamase family protein [Eubacteriales bacterium OttesenSCG-928-A19]|nr:beta-lactamase family protein [Eubacteriales bacterium OttesenSCG-928-A19]
MKKWVEAFAARVDREQLPVEAIVAYEHDALVAEHRWVPDAPRNIYSHTKSFMSTAVGLAIWDGVLSLDDRVVGVLPDAVPDKGAGALAGITLRHLLMMSSGFDRALLMMDTRASLGDIDFARYVLSQPLRQPPGTSFRYSNGDSFLAGRMAEVRLGKTLREYLGERLFAPMDIPTPEWEQDPQGHTFGASGLKLRITDMAKLGRLYLQNGVWAGRQLVDPAWIALATRRHIDVPPDDENNPWQFAYGFQFWMSPYPDAYRADGAYGQITTVLPRADAVVSIQCTESDRFAEVRTALHEELLTRL